MRVEILETCSVVALKGSIVEVTESQFEALGGLCRLMSDDEAKEEKVVKKTVSKTTKAKK